MKKGNEFICIQKALDDDLIEVQFLNGKIDTLKRKLIRRRVNVTLDIQTRTDTLSNVTITEIQPTFYKISQNEKLFNLNLEDVNSINEHILEQDTISTHSNRSMIGVGLGLPFVYLNYDQMISETNGFRAQLMYIIIAGGVLVDYYWNFPITKNIEHNFSISGGLLGIVDVVHGSSSTGAPLIGASYDFKLYFLMIKAGVVIPFIGNSGVPFLPNLSAGVVIEF